MKRLLLFLVLLAVCLLPGCTNPTMIKVDRPVLVEFPAALMQCPAAPAKPVRGPDGIMESQVAGYIIDLRASQEQCAAQMDSLRDLYEAERTQLRP